MAELTSEHIVELIQKEFGENLISSEESYGMLTLVVNKNCA